MKSCLAIISFPNFLVENAKAVMTLKMKSSQGCTKEECVWQFNPTKGPSLERHTVTTKKQEAIPIKDGLNFEEAFRYCDVNGLRLPNGIN